MIPAKQREEFRVVARDGRCRSVKGLARWEAIDAAQRWNNDSDREGEAPYTVEARTLYRSDWGPIETMDPAVNQVQEAREWTLFAPTGSNVPTVDSGPDLLDGEAVTVREVLPTARGTHGS